MDVVGIRGIIILNFEIGLSCLIVTSIVFKKKKKWSLHSFRSFSKTHTFTIVFGQHFVTKITMGVQWLSGNVLDSRPRGCRIEPHLSHCVVSLSKTH